MAKKYDLTTEDKTQKSLAALIDEDLQKESKLLQNLISEVVDANQKLKASHQKRFEETQEKLNILNAEIERLKKDINEKDHDTTLEQLNYLIDAKNKIHQDLRLMRSENIRAYNEGDLYFDMDDLKNKLDNLLKDTLVSHSAIKPYAQKIHARIEQFIDTLKDHTHPLFEENHDLQNKLNDAVMQFHTASEDFETTFQSFSKDFKALLSKREHAFLNPEDDLSLDERIEKTTQEKSKALKAEETALKETFEKNMNVLEGKLDTLYNDTLNKLKEKHRDRLDKEVNIKKTLAQDLKTLRLDIIRAEKNNDQAALKDLLKNYDRLEKHSQNLFEEKLERKAKKQLKSERKKINTEKIKTEKKYLQALYDNLFSQAKIAIEKGDSKEVFKLREDLEALKKDRQLNDDWIKTLSHVLDEYNQFVQKASEFAYLVERLLFSRKQVFLESEMALVDHLEPMQKGFDELTLELLKHVKIKHLNQRILKVKVASEIKMHEKKMALHQQLAKRDKQILDIKLRGDIKRLNLEEDIQNEKIYQQALIALADKEYELQLLKIEALYDSEITLTKAQAERLNVGHDVNEAMVATTLESQINFAKQQMKYAESEHQLRLENIEQSLHRELDYAKEKLAKHEQPYKTDRLELQKERDKKLEDLAYKQALFREEKEKKVLFEQEQEIKESYQEKISAIEKAMAQDTYVKRYKAQIEKAESRANKAKEDAQRIKEKSLETFQNMLYQSEEKLQQFKQSSATSKLAPYIESEAKTTAKERLDEAIKEAKTLYQEKITKPKEKLKALDEQLKNIQLETKQSETIEKIEAEKAELSEAFKQWQQQQQETLKDAQEKIKAEQKAYLKAHNEQLSKLKPFSAKKDKQTLQTKLKQKVRLWEKRLKEQHTKKADKLKLDLAKHKNVLKQEKLNLDKALNPLINAYEAYLKKTNIAQHKREVETKKKLFGERDQAIKDLKNKHQ